MWRRRRSWMLQKPQRHLILHQRRWSNRKQCFRQWRLWLLSIMNVFKIFESHTSSRAVEICSRALNCYCAVLQVMPVFWKSPKTVNMMSLVRQTWKCFASLQKTFLIGKCMDPFFVSPYIFHHGGGVFALTQKSWRKALEKQRFLWWSR